MQLNKTIDINPVCIVIISLWSNCKKVDSTPMTFNSSIYKRFQSFTMVGVHRLSGKTVKIRHYCAYKIINYTFLLFGVRFIRSHCLRGWTRVKGFLFSEIAWQGENKRSYFCCWLGLSGVARPYLFWLTAAPGCPKDDLNHRRG